MHVCVCLTPQLQRCRTALDLSLPPPLDSTVAWLQRAESLLTDGRGEGNSLTAAAKDTWTQRDNLEVGFVSVCVVCFVFTYLFLIRHLAQLMFALERKWKFTAFKMKCCEMITSHNLLLMLPNTAFTKQEGTLPMLFCLFHLTFPNLLLSRFVSDFNQRHEPLCRHPW